MKYPMKIKTKSIDQIESSISLTIESTDKKSAIVQYLLGLTDYTSLKSISIEFPDNLQIELATSNIIFSDQSGVPESNSTECEPCKLHNSFNGGTNVKEE